MARFERVVHGLSVVVLAMRRALRFLFGQMSWQPPGWWTRAGAAMGASARWLRQHPARGALVMFLLVLVAGGGAMLRRWYVHLPRPALVTVTVTAPPATAI